MATEIFGNDYNNTIRQSNYASAEVDIYAYGGNDVIYLDVGGNNGGFNYVEAGSGADRVYNYFEGGNRIYLEDGNDVYYADGFSTATNYVDEVWAGYGDDRIQVSTYQSIYNGEAGNDSFFSVGWANTFHGGAGIDMISYETQDSDADLSGTGVYVDLGQGFATATNEEDETLISIENAVGTGYNDRVYGSNVNNKLWGDDGVDLLNGFNGNDGISGGNGNDSLYGGNGNDTLNAGSGADKLIGGANNDVLYGGGGRDVMAGGTGADTFVFNALSDTTATSARDVINDFYHSESDRINLTALDANTDFGGNQAFDFIGSSSFSGSGGELRFANGVIAGDVNGDRVGDFHIVVTGVTQMYTNDFYL